MISVERPMPEKIYKKISIELNRQAFEGSNSVILILAFLLNKEFFKGKNFLL